MKGDYNSSFRDSSSSLFVFPTDPASTTAAFTGESDSGRIRCICAVEDDDGFTIQCEQCLVWQHAKCVGISKTRVPEQYFCDQCNPTWQEEHSKETDGNIINTSTRGRKPSSANVKQSSSNSNPVTSLASSSQLPSGAPAMNEISENIVSSEALPILQNLLSALPFENLAARMPWFKACKADSEELRQCNFEFLPLIAFPHLDGLRSSFRGTEVREIRSRGYQKKNTTPKYGLFALEDIDPGQLVAEFIGHVQAKNLVTVKGASNLPVTVTQSFVLFPMENVNLAVDARKFGSVVRYARRSCRPNVEIKMVLVRSTSTLGNTSSTAKKPLINETSLHWCLFAKNIIRANSEIILPLDYATGNSLFRYDCACGVPEFCLGWRSEGGKSSNTGGNLLSSPPTKSTSTAEKQTNDAVIAPVEEIKRSSSTLGRVQAPPVVTPATRPIIDTRKLSREERKMQKYIEIFERMDSAEAKKTVPSTTTTTTTSTSGRKNSASSSGTTSRNSISSSSPSKTLSSSPSGKDKDLVDGKHVGLKKTWKHLFGKEDDEEGEGELDESIEDISNIPSNPVKSPKKSSIGSSVKTSPKKPSSSSTTTTKTREDELIDVVGRVEEPRTKRKYVRKNKLPEEDSVINQGSIARPEPKKLKVSKGGLESTGEKPQLTAKFEKMSMSTSESGGAIESHSHSHSHGHSHSHSHSNSSSSSDTDFSEDGKQRSFVDEFVDIERSGSTLGPSDVMVEEESSTSTGNVTSTTVETPSKKKLSLTDYLKKRKASSPATTLSFDDIEEGEGVVEGGGEHGEIIEERGGEDSRPSYNEIEEERTTFSSSSAYSNDYQKRKSMSSPLAHEDFYRSRSASDYTLNPTGDHHHHHHHSTSNLMNQSLRRSNSTIFSSEAIGKGEYDREKERDREMREREFERREREREREREMRTKMMMMMGGSAMSRPPFDPRGYHNTNSNVSSNSNSNSSSNATTNQREYPPPSHHYGHSGYYQPPSYRPGPPSRYQGHSQGQGSHSHPHGHGHHGHHGHGQYPRPPYRPYGPRPPRPPPDHRR